VKPACFPKPKENLCQNQEPENTLVSQLPLISSESTLGYKFFLIKFLELRQILQSSKYPLNKFEKLGMILKGMLYYGLNDSFEGEIFHEELKVTTKFNENNIFMKKTKILVDGYNFICAINSLKIWNCLGKLLGLYLHSRVLNLNSRELQFFQLNNSQDIYQVTFDDLLQNFYWNINFLLFYSSLQIWGK